MSDHNSEKPIYLKKCQECDADRITWEETFQGEKVCGRCYVPYPDKQLKKIIYQFPDKSYGKKQEEPPIFNPFKDVNTKTTTPKLETCKNCPRIRSLFEVTYNGKKICSGCNHPYDDVVTNTSNKDILSLKTNHENCKKCGYGKSLGKEIKEGKEICGHCKRPYEDNDEKNEYVTELKVAKEINPMDNIDLKNCSKCGKIRSIWEQKFCEQCNTPYLDFNKFEKSKIFEFSNITKSTNCTKCNSIRTYWGQKSCGKCGNIYKNVDLPKEKSNRCQFCGKSNLTWEKNYKGETICTFCRQSCDATGYKIPEYVPNRNGNYSKEKLDGLFDKSGGPIITSKAEKEKPKEDYFIGSECPICKKKIKNHEMWGHMTFCNAKRDISEQIGEFIVIHKDDTIDKETKDALFLSSVVKMLKTKEDNFCSVIYDMEIFLVINHKTDNIKEGKEEIGQSKIKDFDIFEKLIYICLLKMKILDNDFFEKIIFYEEQFSVETINLIKETTKNLIDITNFPIFYENFKSSKILKPWILDYCKELCSKITSLHILSEYLNNHKDSDFWISIWINTPKKKIEETPEIETDFYDDTDINDNTDINEIEEIILDEDFE